MDDLNFTFSTTLWQSPGKGGWHFASAPKDCSDQIKFFAHGAKVGFGSVRVKAEIKGVEFKTSLFPDAKSGCYVLPIKAEVRKKAKITAGDKFELRVHVLM